MGNIIIRNVEVERTNEVIALGDQYRATLGFFPIGAYKQAAQNGLIIGAFCDEILVGYLLFRHTTRRNVVTLVHVCVDLTFRSSGIAEMLIQHLISTKDSARWFEANCRRDYNLERFWSKNGFTPVGERDGRAASGSILTKWRRDNREYSLLSLLDDMERQEKVVAVLDTCIVLDLFKSENEESLALLMDGIGEEVAYRITPQCNREINRNGTETERKRLFEYTSRFGMLGEIDQQQNIIMQAELKALYDPGGKNVNDICHLSESIVGGADVFVTRDDWVYSLKKDIYERYGLGIVYPAELVIQIDELIDESLYSPTQLAGSKLSLRKMKSVDLEIVTDLYRYTQYTNKRSFLDALRKYMANGSEFSCFVILKNDMIIAAYVIHDGDESIEFCCLLINERAIKRAYANTLIKHVIVRLISDMPRDVLYIPSDSSKFDYTGALADFGFIKVDKGFLKVRFVGLLSINVLKSKLNQLHDVLSRYTEWDLIQLVDELGGSDHAYLLEQIFWPTVLDDLNLPTYIVPIKPQYAIDLFDERLRDVNPSLLYVEREEVALGIENVYFSSATKKELEFPSRILWYTKQDDHYIGTGVVGSLATVLSTVIGSTSDMYRLFRRFGILTWKTINELGKGKPQSVQAVKFGYVRHAANPIMFSELKDIVRRTMNKNVMLQSAYKITPEAFREIYKRMFVE